MARIILSALIFIILSAGLSAQERSFTAGGFVRGGAYFSTGDYQHDINAAFGDASLTLTATDNLSFKGFGDLRARTGQAFGENNSSFALREAWGMYYNSFMSISAGKKIVRWGKTDIYTPLSRFNPVDYTFRSPDFEDADLGNLLAELTLSPAPFFRLSLVAAPLWNPSLLLIKPIPLPQNMQVILPEGLSTLNGYMSWGVRGDFTLSRFDAGLQYFHGPELMPGLSLINADYTNPAQPAITVEGFPYMISNAGFDFETVLSPFVVRGALAVTTPEEEKDGNEEVPFRQIEWVAGLDWTPGTVRVTAEYSGKKVIGFYDAPYDPILGTEPDMQQLMELFGTPGFDPVEFTRLQIEAFNRLYNNQLHEYYHSAGVRIETDLMNGRLLPSVTTLCNFTSKDFTLRPSIRYKPSDGVTLGAGFEYYSGAAGGMYDIIDDFMNVAYFSIRIDF